MTHDELLAKIDKSLFLMAHTSIKRLRNKKITKQSNALRAVVELAATYKDGNYVNEEFNQGLQTAFQLIIEAIEKELG